MRGEYYNKKKPRYYHVGSPPHARGIYDVRLVVAFGDGLTPACAGNIDMSEVKVSLGEAHPRMRGEYR